MVIDSSVKFCVALLIFISAIYLVNCHPAEKTEATTRPPVSDQALENTLKDKRYLQRLLKCATGDAPCDPVGRKLKSLAPLVLRGSCPQCTDKEQQQIKKVLAYVQVHFPKEWNKMLRQYASG